LRIWWSPFTLVGYQPARGSRRRLGGRRRRAGARRSRGDRHVERGDQRRRLP
jgi:hypothetical protein